MTHDEGTRPRDAANDGLVDNMGVRRGTVIKPIFLEGDNMGYMRINGKTYTGNNIQITNDSIIIDGVLQESNVSGIVKVEVTGDIGSLKVSGSATVHGNVLGDVDAGGSVTCEDVSGDVDAGGSVRCGSVGGDVDAGGSIKMTR